MKFILIFLSFFNFFLLNGQNSFFQEKDSIYFHSDLKYKKIIYNQTYISFELKYNHNFFIRFENDLHIDKVLCYQKMGLYTPTLIASPFMINQSRDKIFISPLLINRLRKKGFYAKGNSKQRYLELIIIFTNGKRIDLKFYHPKMNMNLMGI